VREIEERERERSRREGERGVRVREIEERERERSRRESERERGESVSGILG
jgi:hypothetical protein